jgi:transaldolase
MGVGVVKPAAVFLDRDGVLNAAVVRGGKPYPPDSVADLQIASDAAAALGRLREAGYRLVVVTNQPDVARGVQRRDTVEAINAALMAALPLDEIRVCYHQDSDRCDCRKPAAGLLLREPAHDLSHSFLVGDRSTDIEAGRRAGVAGTVLIDRTYKEGVHSEPDVRVGSLADAATWILSRSVRTRWLDISIFADGASLDDMKAWARRPHVRGFTTNPTLMRRAGVQDYARFGRDAVAAIPDRPISFEVFSDDFAEMERQAREIASWGPNVFVKIPITNTRGESAAALIHCLSHGGVQVNVTAVLSVQQVQVALDALAGGTAANVSIFAGRIADTGRDPVPIVADALALAAAVPSVRFIWASPREVLNVYQANDIGCHIITLTSDLLQKLSLDGKDLAAFSLETVRMFREDAVKAGYALKGSEQLT